MEEKKLKPDYLFEVSWEVCNKVGGIYTVISTKANSLIKDLKGNYIVIGPDVWKETSANPEFEEDKFLYHSWRVEAESKGLRFKIGRWKIPGSPVAILVDFTPYFAIKDKIFAHFWEKYHLDSLSGQWDYVEPVMFGYAAAKVIESFYDFNISGRDKVIAQFHEWMTGSGILYLKDTVPQVGTVFTTHATAIARSIAGNGLPLYRNIEKYDAEVLAKDFNIIAKQSLEKKSAQLADTFTTVSEITAKECKYFLNKSIDLITPNGFEDSFVPNEKNFGEKRIAARERLFDVADALLNQEVPRNSLLVTISGRYEFKNKGMDLFIDSLGKLNRTENLDINILAFILVPGNHAGRRKDIFDRIGKPDYGNPISGEYLTHYLHEEENDPSIRRIKENLLKNSIDDKVKVIFVPSYLNGHDGIINLHYYDTLIGFDVSVFPSYYEPWGYTPMESLAFHIPTITTSLAGFGKWVKTNCDPDEESVAVIERNDDNDSEVVENIAAKLLKFSHSSAEGKLKTEKKAYEISKAVNWKNFISYYYNAYSLTLHKVAERSELYKNKQLPEQVSVLKTPQQNIPVWKKVLFVSEYPESLSNLVTLTKNLWWTWNYEAQELFEMIDSELWEKFHHNPIALIQALSHEQLLKLENNEDFVNKLAFVYNKFELYMKEASEKPKEQVAYFSMEFGLHDSLKIFSGGLGILAGDYLKQASDSNANIVGVGLLYRYGYFTQNLSLSGEQLEAYVPQKFSLLPLNPVRIDDGQNSENGNNWLKIRLALPGRTLLAKVWRVDVGRTPLYLLDTDIEENTPEDRNITHQLYGGSWENRLKQELLLGVGGIRLLDAVGLTPDIYHCNEGHAAFIGIERMRKFVQEDFFTFHEALEIVRASTLFTTHTPVPAGHDAFSEDLLRTYIPHYADRLNISWETFMNLGRERENNISDKFSMSVLAVKLSQEVNGVSKIHGRVSREMFNYLWSGFFPEEIHIGYVTNGVHYPTWTSKKWQKLYQESFGEGFENDISNKEYWKKIFTVTDEKIWKIRQTERKELIDFLKTRLMENLTKRQENPKTIIEVIDSFNENALTIGFARRFATYKRADLLFKNLEKLARIVNNPQMPVQFIFAGKAHPADEAGQNLIKEIFEISRKKEFIGKITFLENYDMEIASKLVQGVDIWLNTPTRPLEASGTSGQKAAMNGVINFSVLDGWWAEGYIEKAGWALKEEITFENPLFQDELDAETIYDILEDQIIPIFYKRDKQGIPSKWISYIKNNIAEIAPDFTNKRMIDDYVNQYYSKLTERSAKIKENDFEMVRKINAWKKKMIRGWDSIEVVSIIAPDSSKRPFKIGEKFIAEITLDLNELSPEYVGIEVLFGQKEMDKITTIAYKYDMEITNTDKTFATFKTEIFVTRSGVFDYAFRMYPKNKLLPHRQDFNLVKWL
ncbi:MAG: alpha-glucan family phosphorylase [Bacteroidetes bacterium]|nr:alpha-glucan family phosphorylase [Bacteroidota bacterium]